MEAIMSAIFCRNSAQPFGSETIQSSTILSGIINPYSCTNHTFLIFSNLLLFLITITLLSTLHFRHKRSSPAHSSPSYIQTRAWASASAAGVFSSALGSGYLSLGLWNLGNNLIHDEKLLPWQQLWITESVQGVTCLFLGLTLSLNKRRFVALSREIIYLYCCSLLSCFIAALQSAFSLRLIVLDKSASVKAILDVLLFPASILLLVSAFRIHRAAARGGGGGGGKEPDVGGDGTFYTPLRDEDDDDINAVTPFSKAGFFSRLSFWWLNPLLRKGSQTVLDDNDIPRLRKQDRAKTCYLDFMDRITKHEGFQPSILSTIFSWQKSHIFVSGVFALIKVLTLATGPLFLKAFIDVAEGDREGFKYKGYALAALLFLTKCLESLSERQWSFRTRMIGLQVRSMLCAAIYQKQLKLSNTAKTTHSPGEIVNYLTVDAYRIGEFPILFHQLWTVGLQMSLALVIIYYSVGLATIATLAVVILSVLLNSPLGKLQQKNQTKLMAGQDQRLRTMTEALVIMKVLKLYAWEMHFKSVIEKLREIEFMSLSAVLLQKGYYIILFWSFPIVMSVSTFGACYILGVGLNTSNVFMFLATLRIIQEPVRLLPDVAGAYIEASVSLDRIVRFLEAPELQNQQKQGQGGNRETNSEAIVIRSTGISWESFSSQPTLRNINLNIRSGEKVAICGEVGTGKSTLLATILGEVPNVNGSVQVHGKIAYVSQTAWIQTGTIRENILFGSTFDPLRYEDTIARCSLVKDVQMLPFGDLTVIGERGVNLSGGQKQRIQLARALYQDADLYLLDDPFSAVDAQTATSLFHEYVMGALSSKTVLLVTHQVDFLPAFDSLLLMCDGQILRSGTFSQLMETSPEFQSLVNAHKDGIHSETETRKLSSKSTASRVDIYKICTDDQTEQVSQDQLIQQEERETGDNGLKPYVDYLSQGKGFLYLSIAVSAHIVFLAGQSLQSYWLAANLGNSNTSGLKLIAVYSIIGGSLALLLFIRSFATVTLSLEASKSTFCTLLSSLFQAPMSFFDSTPIGRILSRVSSDISIIDLDVAFMISQTMAATLATFFSFGILAILTWEVLFVIIPMVYLTTILQKYYFATAKELMRINGTTKSAVASNLAESISGAMTIRAFNKEDQFFTRIVEIIDKNASPFFHGFSANEWLIQYLEILCAVVLSSSALALTLLPSGATSSGFIGMALSYGLSLNLYLVGSVQNQCTLSNMIISAERISQYMHIQSESAEIIQDNRPPSYWPHAGRLEISDLKVRYRQNSPLVLRGITCTFEGGSKIGIVGRTGSGKTTLLSTLFRLVEPSEGKIIIDGIDITTIGLHDLRSSLGIIPQDPTLFSGSVRYNLDPLSHHSEQEIWDVLEKCQLKDVVRKKEGGLDSLVLQDGLNWSMGQRQLFCLGRALLKRRKILVLDEATASIDNTTDVILQRTIRREFVHCTVITVAHRIPTVMDCTKVLGISDGKVVEFDEPLKLISKEDSLFGKLVKEYWSHSGNASCLSR